MRRRGALPPAGPLGFGVRPVRVGDIIAYKRRFGMKAMMKETKRNCGIPPLFAAAALLMAAMAMAGCLNPIAPPAAKAAAASAAAEAEAAFDAAQREPYTAAVYLGGDGEDADARSIAGPTKEQISLTGIRNYVQLIAVDKADRTIAGFYEERGSGAGASASLMLKGLATGRTYGILLLQGHWERDYAAETAGGAYAYTNNPPTLLSAGYVDVPFTRDSSSVAIGAWPIYVDTVFTAAGLSAEPAVTAGKPEAVSLAAAGEWAANWKILRGASGTASGLGDLVTAQKAAGFLEESFIATGKKAAVWTAASSAPDTLDSLTLTGHTVTLPLADYTGLSQTGMGGAVNFALSFIPFNVTEGWAKYDASSVFDLRNGPPQWVIRNGINDLPQDDRTDFTNFGIAPVTEANGNGAVRFTTAAPLPAAPGELVVSDSYFTEPSVFFTTSGYTGRAQVWWAAVPSGGGAPAYAAYIPLGDAAPGTHIKMLTLPVPGTAYDIYLVLLKDGKAGAVHQIGVEPEPPLPGTLTSVAAARAYLDSLAADGDSRGGSAGDPVPLLMKMHLSGADSLKNLLSLIAEKGKYVDLDLSQCGMDGTAFVPGGANTGKDLVASLVLPDVARTIGWNPDASSPLPPNVEEMDPFLGFTSLRAAGGSGITVIGSRVFDPCRKALTSVDFPAAATLSRDAFASCTALTTVNLPALTTLKHNAFYDCTALTAVNLPALTTIEYDAFLRCTALATVNLPALTTLVRDAFYSCTALTTVNLPALTSIKRDAFLNTGTGNLTITLGRNAPQVDDLQGSGNAARTVIVRRPANNAGYDAAWQEAFKKSFSRKAAITLRFQDL
jgi:hypothetical protein